MALLESCFCCSLLLASAVVGVYSVVAYIVAFTIELWWILESEVTLPAPAYLLCACYFITFVMSAFLLHGITVKRTLFLLTWMFVVAALLFPEAGLILFMSLQYWKLTSLYGLTEISYWICRVICNIAGLLCIQSLYSTWKEEKIVLKRLQVLNTVNTNPNIPNNGPLKNGNAVPCYQNGGFIPSTIRLNSLSSSVPAISRLQRSASSVSHLHLQPPYIFGGSLPNNEAASHTMQLTPLNNLQYAYFGIPDSAATQSEFNASTFDGYFAMSINSNIDASEKMSRINLFKNNLGTPMHRTRSLVDLRDNVKFANSWCSSVPVNAFSLDYMTRNPSNFTQSLDRRLFKNSGNLRRASSLGELSNIVKYSNASFALEDMGRSDMRRIFLRPPYGYHFYGRPRSCEPSCGSKRSLAESDEMQKIRDVAL